MANEDYNLTLTKRETLLICESLLIREKELYKKSFDFKTEPAKALELKILLKPFLERLKIKESSNIDSMLKEVRKKL